MKFKVETKEPYTFEYVKEILEPYPIIVEDGSDIEVEWNHAYVYGMYSKEMYPFPKDQYGVLITELDQYWRGLAKAYGQASVYWSKTDERKTMCLAPLVFRLRIVHEVLHHYNLPCHDVDIWLKDHPFLRLLWIIGGSGKRYSLFECLCKDLYYKYLLDGFDEEEFNRVNDMDNRRPNGTLITED